jgi:hypothetical protein
MDRNRQGREYHCRLNANSPGPRLWPDADLRQCRLRAVAKGIATWDRALIRSVSTYEVRASATQQGAFLKRSDAAASRRVHLSGLAMGCRNGLSVCRGKKVQSRGTNFADGLQAEALFLVVQSLRSNPFDVGERQCNGC